MCTLTQNKETFIILNEMTKVLENVVKENNNPAIKQIFEDFKKAETVEEKIWIAEAFEENI